MARTTGDGPFCSILTRTMLNPNTVYFKTKAGVAEVASRALGLRAELRRLLILVDGNAPLARLAAFVRGSEIDFLIAELEAQGLISRDGASAGGASMTSGASNVVGVAPPSIAHVEGGPEPTVAQMLAVRHTAIRLLDELLGHGATVMAIRIDRCKDAQELRIAITEIRQTLDRQLGVATGQRFLEAVRSAAEGTR